jgi:hypothetical protein
VGGLIPDNEEWMNSLAEKKKGGELGLDLNDEPMVAEDFEESWERQYRHGLAWFVDACGLQWKLKSLTIHNLTVESIPAVSTEHTFHKIFFAALPPYSGRHESESYERARDIADAVCMLGPPDESCFHFVDADDGAGIEALVWDEMERNLFKLVCGQISFLSRNEVDECVCCGVM